MKGVLLAIALVLVGCGSPTSLDFCHKGCDVQKRCGALSDTEAANCNTKCDADKAMYADIDANCDKLCTNCADIRSKLFACGDDECNKVATCIQSVDQTCAMK
jgi:hypothetical protein